MWLTASLAKPCTMTDMKIFSGTTNRSSIPRRYPRTGPSTHTTTLS